MGDAHASSNDPHLAHAILFGAHSTLEGLAMEHEFVPHEYENPAHHSLSPYQVNMGGTLSRPPSMASMSNFALPPVQPPLSRVGSLSNLTNFNFQHQMPHAQMPQNLFFQPPLNGMPHPHAGFFTPSYIPQQPGQPQQQQTSPSQLLSFPMVGSAEFRMIQGDFPQFAAATSHAPTPAKSTNTSKSTKKSRSKRPAQPSRAPSAPEIPPVKNVKSEKAVEKKQKVIDEPKPQRSRNPSSIYRGVSKCSKDGRWQARIRVKRQVTYLGRFVKEEDAARKYDEAARIHHGDKAVLNFPTEEDKQLGRKQATTVLGGGDDDDDQSDE